MTFRGPQELTNKMKALLRFNYRWDYTGEASPQRTDPQRGSCAEDSSDEEIELEFDRPADQEAEVYNSLEDINLLNFMVEFVKTGKFLAFSHKIYANFFTVFTDLTIKFNKLMSSSLLHFSFRIGRSIKLYFSISSSEESSAHDPL